MTCLAIVAAGCHGGGRARPDLPPAEERVATAMAAWGRALESGDQRAVLETEDVVGQMALVYLGIKAAASKLPDGAEAVERTVTGIVVMAVLRAIYGGHPDDSFPLALPTGSLARALVAAGLAERTGPRGTPFATVEVPWRQSFGRLQEASARHRRDLREREAWTCRPGKIDRTILPSEPSLERGAAISPHIFGDWLADLDAIWLVRANCEGGPGLFVVTGHVDRQSGAAADRILAVALAPAG